MSKMNKTQAVSTQAPSAPIFVPKQENVVQLSLDESIEMVKKLQAEKAAIDKKINNLKEVAKTLMKGAGVESHTTPTGIRAFFSKSQRADINKALAKELCGPRWSEVESFNTVISFTIT